LRRGFVRLVVLPLVVAATLTLVWAIDRYAGELSAHTLARRITITALALVPLGLLLGMPFPTALARAPQGVVPWAIAANGFMSVIGASAALPLAMILGYHWLFVVACACYLLAALAYPKPAEPAPIVVNESADVWSSVPT
jgi:hypothetical protein